MKKIVWLIIAMFAGWGKTKRSITIFKYMWCDCNNWKGCDTSSTRSGGGFETVEEGHSLIWWYEAKDNNIKDEAFANFSLMFTLQWISQGSIM